MWLAQQDLELQSVDIAACARLIIEEKTQEAHNSRVQFRIWAESAPGQGATFFIELGVENTMLEEKLEPV